MRHAVTSARSSRSSSAERANGIPLDYESDSLADYFEDLNNSGAYDAGLGETDRQTYNSKYGIGSGPGLVVSTPLK